MVLLGFFKEELSELYMTHILLTPHQEIDIGLSRA